MPLQLAELLYKHRDKSGDVTFVVESQRIRAHRCVLAASSSIYNNDFFDCEPRGGDDIAVPNVAANDFNEFVKCFYSLSMDLSIENIENILGLAAESKFKECTQACEVFLKFQTKAANIWFVYELSIKYDLPCVQQHCSVTIGLDAEDALKSNSFYESDYKVLLRVLENPLLACQEIDVLKACIAWAKTTCRRKGLDYDDVHALRAVVGDAATLIRFASMTIHEFCDFNREYDGFFSPEEFIEISSIIYQDFLNDFKPKKFNPKRRRN